MLGLWRHGMELLWGLLLILCLESYLKTIWFQWLFVKCWNIIYILFDVHCFIKGHTIAQTKDTSYEFNNFSRLLINETSTNNHLRHLRKLPKNFLPPHRVPYQWRIRKLNMLKNNPFYYSILLSKITSKSIPYFLKYHISWWIMTTLVDICIVCSKTR